jgi:hypothetical protein
MNKAILLILPVIAVVMVSGCTDIPFFSGLFGPQVVKYENDIVVIRSLDVTPNTVFPEQTARVTTYIQNQGKDEVPNVRVELYDYCKGTFKIKDMTCNGKTESVETSTCSIEKLSPYETREVRWTIEADAGIKLKTVCPSDGLKVSVNYPYKTEGVSTISLINSNEMQQQMSDGTYSEKQSYIVAGQGPVKGYITVEDKQPVPVGISSGDKTVIGFQLKNEGGGFLAFAPDANPAANEKPKIRIETFDLPKAGPSMVISTESESCSQLKPDGKIGLIQQESPKAVCSVTITDMEAITKESTSTMKFSISYNYEFRSRAKITVMPKAM